MKHFAILGWTALLLSVVALPTLADEDLIVTGRSEAAEGLDLQAVADVFRTADDPEAFERALNDPDVGVNNLDLNGDGEVDYLRVMEEVDGDTHVFVIQAALAENEYQDVATVELEPGDDDDYHFQVHGSAVIYGPNYYVVPPAGIYVRTWPIVTFIYRPVYRPWRSVVYWGAYPRWWRPWRPVHVHVYRARPVHVHHVNYSVSRTTHVHTARGVYTRPTSSSIVTRKAGAFRTKDGSATAKSAKRTRATASGNEVETRKAGRRTVDGKTGSVTTGRKAAVQKSDAAGKTTTAKKKPAKKQAKSKKPKKPKKPKKSKKKTSGGGKRGSGKKR